MADEEKVIYGDGTHEAKAGPEFVTITDGVAAVSVSRAAFREIVIGWKRLLDQEAGE